MREYMKFTITAEGAEKPFNLDDSEDNRKAMLKNFIDAGVKNVTFYSNTCSLPIYSTDVKNGSDSYMDKLCKEIDSALWGWVNHAMGIE